MEDTRGQIGMSLEIEQISFLFVLAFLLGVLQIRSTVLYGRIVSLEELLKHLQNHEYAGMIKETELDDSREEEVTGSNFHC